MQNVSHDNIRTTGFGGLLQGLGGVASMIPGGGGIIVGVAQGVGGTMQQGEQQKMQQKQMQEQQIKSQQEIEKMKIDSVAAEKEKDRQRDILVAEIRAAGYGAMGDVDQNQMSDYRDAMKDIKATQQYQAQTDLQKTKEDNRVSSDRDKIALEREKINMQREIADKQLQIAQVNKNKYDKGGSTKSKDQS